MELTFKELRKREVINIADGQSLGRVVDITLDFPKGVLVGISVPSRRRGGLFSLFDRSTLYIHESKILKIGSDVILVDVNCGSACAPNINLNKGGGKKPPCPPCPPTHTNPCPPPRHEQCQKSPHVDDDFRIFNDQIRNDNDDY